MKQALNFNIYNLQGRKKSHLEVAPTSGLIKISNVRTTILLNLKANLILTWLAPNREEIEKVLILPPVSLNSKLKKYTLEEKV